MLLKVSLEDYHTTDTLHFKEVFFDFATHQKLGQWKVNVRKLEADLAAHKFKRKVIFVTVHSDMERGDLFAGTDEDGREFAMKVEEVSVSQRLQSVLLIFLFQFMPRLFFGYLGNVITRSTLFLLACGPLVEFEESFLALKSSIKR